MKRIVLTVAATLALAGGLAACSKKEAAPAPAAATPVEATPMAAAPAAPAAPSDMGGMAMAADAKMATGTGTVTAVAADSITVDHAPIPEAGWPAMTMTFKAAPDVAKSVKVGEKVAFDLKVQGGGGEITAVRKP